ncbi:MAG: right-handed parallel beta-helix repeat-containing protein, partial [Promethearchaeota archaeon]
MKSHYKSNLIIFGILLALFPLIASNFNFIINNNSKSFVYVDNISLERENLGASAVVGNINIDGDSGWSNAKIAGICTGSGFISNPYVIEDLTVIGSGWGSCILIENSDAYFRIENCTIRNSGEYWGDAGIRLDALVSNGQLINNTIYNSYNGIYIYQTTNINISRNTIFNNSGTGIHMYHMSDSFISDNIIFTNDMGLIL